jgi:protoporphyrinogen oxidase
MSKPRIYTGQFSRSIDYLSNHLTLVSIDRSIPKRYRELVHYTIDDLKPSWASSKKDENVQRLMYTKKLNQANPRKVLKQLKQIAKDNYSKGIVLLTWQDTKTYSNRKQVAKWLKRFTGTRVIEYKTKVIRVDQKLLTDD